MRSIICGYLKYDGLGYTQASWPLALFTIEEDKVTLQSPFETIVIDRCQIMDVKTQWFCARIYYEDRERPQELKIYALGADGHVRNWWERR